MAHIPADQRAPDTENKMAKRADDPVRQSASGARMCDGRVTGTGSG
jgi:hypothetical protein